MTVWQDCRDLCVRYRDDLVIVEGKKDISSLHALGFTNIISLNKPLHEIIEYVVHKKPSRVLILTDLDDEGKKLFATFSTQFSERGITMDHTFRQFVRASTPVRHIEGLHTYMEREEEKERHHHGLRPRPKP